MRRAAILLGVVILAGCQKPSAPDVVMESYNFFITLPRDYSADREWPLILFLHGAGGGSTRLATFKSYGLGDFADAHEDFPFIVVAPQSEDEWYPDPIGALLDRVISEYAVDESRIYVTGFSLGGFGSFYMPLEFPNRFAAAAPVCGWGWEDRVCEISHVPFWFFHNDGDPQISVNYSRELYNTLLGCGADEVRLTIYESDSHNAWTRAYSDPALYDWFLSHQLEPQGGAQ